MADPVDYGALAQKFGGTSTAPASGQTIDYEALAKKNGAISSTPAAASGPNVSPTASDDDIIKSFGYDPAVIKASPRYQTAVQSHGSGLQYALTQPGEIGPTRDKILNAPVVAQIGDAGHGAYDVLTGLVQLARHGAAKTGMLSDADVQYGDLLDRVGNADYEQNVRHGNVSGAMRTVGNMLVPIPGQSSAKTLAGAIGLGALHGGEAALTQPVLQGDPNGFAGEKLGQVATGAGIGTVLGGGAHVVANLPTTSFNAGKIVGFRNTKLPEEVAGNVTGQLAERTGKVDWGGRADVEKAAAGGNKEAQSVVEAMDNASTEGDVAQASIKLQKFRNQQVASDLYGKVDQLVDKAKLAPAPLPGTLNALNDAGRQARLGLKSENAGLVSVIEDIRNKILPQTPASKASGLLDANGNPLPAATPAAPTPAADYKTVRSVISDLDTVIRERRTSNNALVTDRGTGQLQRIKNALETDLTGHLQKSGKVDILNAQELADKYYSQEVVPFKERNVAAAGATDETDTIFDKFIQGGRVDRAKKLYDSLDPKGQAAVQYQLVQKAIDTATDPVKGFNSSSFVKTLDNKMAGGYDTFFPGGADRQAIDGMRNYVVNAAKVDAMGPFTGTKGAAVAAIPRAKEVLQFLSTADNGRRMLYTLSQLKPNNPFMVPVMKEVEAAAARWATLQSGVPPSATSGTASTEKKLDPALAAAQ